ncbi:MAG: hypothetical protein GY711_02335 [bacterium]|nr:hypothetical protein [bacterium]
MMRRKKLLLASAVAAAWGHELFAMRPDRAYVHALLPGRQRSNEIPGREERWTYTINAWGMRGLRSGASPSGVARAVFRSSSSFSRTSRSSVRTTPTARSTSS